jgi:hypothetical protein
MRAIVPITILLCLTGCLGRKPVVPAASGTIGGSADAARSAERFSAAERDSQTLASLRALLARVPDLRENAWREELALMIARYRDVPVSPAHAEAAAARVSAWAEGRETEAKAMTQAAMVDVEVFVSRVLAEKSARIEAEKREAESRAASALEIAKLKQAVQDAQNATMKRTAWAIVLGSLACIGLSLAYVVLSPNKLSALTGAGPAAIVGLLGLGLAQLITRPWFMPACGVTAALGASALAWWAYQKHKEGRLAAELQAKATLAQSTLGKVVPAIDDLFDQTRKGAVTSASAVFDALFERLSKDPGKKMTPEEKQQIHMTRAALNPAQ